MNQFLLLQQPRQETLGLDPKFTQDEGLQHELGFLGWHSLKLLVSEKTNNHSAVSKENPLGWINKGHVKMLVVSVFFSRKKINF